jgi:hypothetical protein
MSATTTQQMIIATHNQPLEEELLGYKVVRKSDSEPPHLCFSCKEPIAIYGRCVCIFECVFFKLESIQFIFFCLS